ncbi:MAG: carbohydrate-binding protein [Cyanobacteria bacterium J06600_6]
MNEALFSIDPQSTLEFSSTFTAGSFQLTNSSDSQDIVSITLDLSSALFPDLVFDPTGDAGDTTAKGFEFDSQNDPGNTISIANFPFNDPSTPFSRIRNGGYDVLSLEFTSFKPGQVLKFSADVDPTSIQGADDPGPSDSGSISGLELVGATITVKFADDTELTGQVYRTAGSEVASEVTLAAAPQTAPEIEAIGFDAAATVNDANQTIRVTGNAGSEVSLLIVEGGFYTGGGGVDPDPDAFEANKAIAVKEITATIGNGGFVDVPVNLTYTEVDGSGGLNYIVAKYQGNSLVSDRVVLEFNPDGTTDPGTIDPGTTDPGTQTPLAEGAIRIEGENYKAGTNGTEYFDFEPENLGKAFRLNEEVDIEVTGDVGGGFNVAFIKDGEFLTYDINVPTAREYDIVFRVAANADAQRLEAVIGEQTYTASFDSTGGFQTYTDVVIKNVALPAGAQELRFNAKSSDFNFNYFDLIPAEPREPVVDTTAPTAVLNTATASH